MVRAVSFWGLMFVLWLGADMHLLRNIPLLLMLVFVFGTLHLKLEKRRRKTERKNRNGDDIRIRISLAPPPNLFASEDTESEVKRGNFPFTLFRFRLRSVLRVA